MDPRLTLRQLEQLVALAEAGSFVGAAELVHLTPNAVSQNVSELERIVGSALTVRRRARGVSLTPAGQRLVVRARALLHQAEQLLEDTEDGPGPRGPVSVGCYGPLAPTMLPRLWSRVVERLPRVDLSVVDGDTDSLTDRLERGELDLAITYAINLTDRMRTSPLTRLPLRVSLPADHPLAAGESVDLDDLADEPLVLLDRTPSGQNSLNILRRRGLSPRISHRVRDVELMRSFVARGAGYGIHFTEVSATTSRDGLGVTCLPVRPATEVEPVVLAWHPAYTMTKRVLAVMAVCREEFGA